MRHASLRWVYAGICACVAVGAFQFAIEAWRAWHGTFLWSSSIFSGVSVLFALTVVWVARNWHLARWLSGLTGVLFASLALLALFRWLQIGGTRTHLVFSLATGSAAAAGISLALLRGGDRASGPFEGPKRTLVQGGVVLGLLLVSVSVFPAISALSGWRRCLVTSAHESWSSFLDLKYSVSKAVRSQYSNLICGEGGRDLPATSTRVVRLEVHTWHSGMVPSSGKRLHDLVISCEPRRCTSDGGEVPVELVEAFFAAVLQPEMASIDLQNLGVNRDWVRRAVAKERVRYDRENPDSTAFEREFGSRLHDCAARPEVLRSLLATYYDPRYLWYEDYPSVMARATLSSGSTVELSSQSQKEFMLPWRVVTRTKSRLTYDARISRALAALLPRDFLERHRIAGESLAWRYLHFFSYRSPAVCGNGANAP
jgi:hypothetical protein